MATKIELKSLTFYEDRIWNMVSKSSAKLSNSVISDLKKTAPKDDTTKAKAEMIYKRTGKRAWVKDDVARREFWELSGTFRHRRHKVTSEITNNNPAVVALALGFISPLNISSEAVERIPNGLFSEQSPDGRYALESIKRAMVKLGYTNVKYNRNE